MKTICVLLAVLALALAEPAVYFREEFEDGKSNSSGPLQTSATYTLTWQTSGSSHVGC